MVELRWPIQLQFNSPSICHVTVTLEGSHMFRYDFSMNVFSNGDLVSS